MNEIKIYRAVRWNPLLYLLIVFALPVHIVECLTGNTKLIRYFYQVSAIFAKDYNLVNPSKLAKILYIVKEVPPK